MSMLSGVTLVESIWWQLRSSVTCIRCISGFIKMYTIYDSGKFVVFTQCDVPITEHHAEVGIAWQWKAIVDELPLKAIEEISLGNFPSMHGNIEYAYTDLPGRVVKGD